MVGPHGPDRAQLAPAAKPTNTRTESAWCHRRGGNDRDGKEPAVVLTCSIWSPSHKGSIPAMSRIFPSERSIEPLGKKSTGAMRADSTATGQNSREAAKRGKKLFCERLDISLWNGIGQQEFKQLLVSICSVISSDEVSFEPFPMTSLTFNF